jgi:hypothetical protein
VALPPYRLSDDRKNGPLSPEIVEFGRNDWNSRAIAAGWKYWANVVPEELVAAGTLTSVMGELYNTLRKSISSFVCIGAITKKQLLIGMNTVLLKTDIQCKPRGNIVKIFSNLK